MCLDFFGRNEIQQKGKLITEGKVSIKDPGHSEEWTSFSRGFFLVVVKLKSF